MRIERKLEKVERQKKKLKVSDLSFNTYYEFALERIPQIMKQQNISFDIHNFATILKPFYKGGEKEYILNNDLDASLFDEKFIVFEIDKVKDDKVLFLSSYLLSWTCSPRRCELRRAENAWLSRKPGKP